MIACAVGSCRTIPDTGYCTMEPCGIGLSNPVPPGRSAVCDYNVDDTPPGWDHCLVWDGAQEPFPSTGEGSVMENCRRPGDTRVNENEDKVCTALKDPIVGAEDPNCEVGGVPARCMWVPREWIEDFPP